MKAPVADLADPLRLQQFLGPLLQRFLAPLQIGDVDTDADAAAIGRPALLDPHPAVAPQVLLEGAVVTPVPRGPLGEPLLLAPDSLEVVPSLDAEAHRVCEVCTDLNGVAGGIVELEELPVEKKVAPLRIEQDKSFGHDFEGVHQASVRLLQLVGHQGNGAVGSLAIALGLDVGGLDDLGERVQVELAILTRGPRHLSREKPAHDDQ